MSTTFSPGHLQTSGPRMPAKASPEVNPSNEVPAPPKRRSTRLTISIPILVRGKDEQGVPFTEQAQTLVVSLHGAMIALSRRLNLDSEIVIENPALHKAAEAVVLWCKQKGPQPAYHEAAVELKQPQDLCGVSFPSWEKESPAGATSARDASSVPVETPSAAPAESSPAASLLTGPPPRPSVDAPAPVQHACETSPKGAVSTATQAAETTQPVQADYLEEQGRFKAALKDLSAETVEEVRLLTEAHVRLFNGSLAKRALDTSETCVKKLDQSLADIGHATLEELRKQMEHELQTFTERASAQSARLAESILKAIESKIESIQIRVVRSRTAGH